MQNYVELKSGDYILRGFMHKPDEIHGKLPMVIFFHGYSASKTDFWFVETSRQLESLGIASLRFDFMGSGDSDGRFQDMSIETEINDGIEILRYAQSLSFVDPSRIALVGASYGGLVASIIAGRLPSDIKALCMWCPAIIAIQDAREGRAGDTDITSALTTGIADINGLLVGKRFVEDARKLDFEVEASGYKNNAIVIWGDKDPIVPPDIINRCELVYGERLEKCMIEGVGHMFETRAARARKIEATIGFLNKELKLL
jgi:pimeloyl-ACP methyl ester carboxylesterase